MIQREWTPCTVYTLTNQIDKYGQKRLFYSSKDTSREIFIKHYERGVINNPKYLDVEYIGLIKGDIHTNQLIQVGSTYYRIIDTIYAPKFTQVFMKETDERPEPVINYFYIEGDGEFSLVNGGTETFTPNLLMSTDLSNWSALPVDTSISINGKLFIKAGEGGNNGTGSSSTSYTELSSSNLLTLGGDISTLISADGNVTDLRNTTGYNFYNLCYHYMDRNVAIKDLVIPFEYVVPHCFHNTFRGAVSVQVEHRQVNLDLASVKYVGTSSFHSMFYNNVNTAFTVDMSNVKGSISEDMNEIADNFSLQTNAFNEFLTYCQGATLKLSSANPTNNVYRRLVRNSYWNCYITVGWTSFGDGSGTTQWAQNESYHGVLYCPSELGDNDTIQRGDNYCSDAWTVINTD